MHMILLPCLAYLNYLSARTLEKGFGELLLLPHPLYMLFHNAALHGSNTNGLLFVMFWGTAM